MGFQDEQDYIMRMIKEDSCTWKNLQTGRA